MRLSDYATKNRIGDFYNGTVQAAYLNYIDIPSPALICDHQKDLFKATFDVQDSNVPPELQEFLKGVNNSSEGFEYINETIKKIEGYITALSAGSPAELFYKANLMDLCEQGNFSFENFLSECRAFFDNLKENNSLSSVSSAFTYLMNHLDNVEKFIQEKGTSGVFDFNHRINWVEYHIKGQYLEAAAAEWLLKKVPSSILIQSGQFYGAYDIFGGFKQKQSKEDFMLFDSDNFLISYKIGKEQQTYTCSLKEFIETMKNSSERKSIHLTQESYDEMSRHMIAGFQAKATRTNTIRWGSISIANAGGAYSGTLDGALATLQEIYFAKSGGNRVTAKTSVLQNSHPDYTALFNYSLAHHLGFLIGKNNRILVTRDGISDLYNEVLKSFNAGKYFYGVGNINLSNRRVIQVKQDID